MTADGQTTLVGCSSGQIGLIVNRSGSIMDHFLCEATPGKAHLDIVRLLALSADEARMVSAAATPAGLEVKVWDYPKRKQLGPALEAPGEPWTMDVSPDRGAVVIGTRAAGVHVRVFER